MRKAAGYIEDARKRKLESKRVLQEAGDIIDMARSIAKLDAVLAERGRYCGETAEHRHRHRKETPPATNGEPGRPKERKKKRTKRGTACQGYRCRRTLARGVSLEEMVRSLEKKKRRSCGTPRNPAEETSI